MLMSPERMSVSCCSARTSFSRECHASRAKAHHVDLDAGRQNQHPRRACNFFLSRVHRKRLVQQSSCMMVWTETCSSRMLSLPWHESGDDDGFPRRFGVLHPGEGLSANRT